MKMKEQLLRNAKDNSGARARCISDLEYRKLNVHIELSLFHCFFRLINEEN